MKRKKKKKQYSHIAEDFFERLAAMCDTPVYDAITKTFVERPTTFRVNTLKSSRHEALHALQESGFRVKPVSWYKDAFILVDQSKRELMALPLYQEGHIYVQSLASMVPPLVLDPKSGEKVLDIAAAPGSKTSQIAALMERQGELVANDKNKIRFFKLKANMELLGVADVWEPWSFSLRMEPGVKLAREYSNYFDKILLDAPCSAEARFIALQPKTFAYWKIQKIKEMAYTQRTLLFSAWQALKPGGVLVYATCTFAPEENEVQISRFLERTPDAEMMPCLISDLDTLPLVSLWKDKAIHPAVVKHALRIKPTKETEGFFVAKIRKKE